MNKIILLVGLSLTVVLGHNTCDNLTVKSGEKYKIVAATSIFSTSTALNPRSLESGQPVLACKSNECGNIVWKAFQVYENNDSIFQFLSSSENNMALDCSLNDAIRGKPIVFEAWKGVELENDRGKNQRWRLEMETHNFVPFYYLRNAYYNGKVLQFNGDDTEVSIEVQDTNNPNQRWVFVKV